MVGKKIQALSEMTNLLGRVSVFRNHIFPERKGLAV